MRSTSPRNFSNRPATSLSWWALELEGDDLGASRFLKVCHGRKEGLPPRLDVEREIAVQERSAS